MECGVVAAEGFQRQAARGNESVAAPRKEFKKIKMNVAVGPINSPAVRGMNNTTHAR